MSEILLEDDFVHNKVRSELSYKSLRNRLPKNDKQYNVILQVKNHVMELEKILQQKNNNEQTALQLLYEKNQYYDYINKVSKLLDVSELYKNYNDFNENFSNILLNSESEKENLIGKIYNKYLINTGNI